MNGNGTTRVSVVEVVRYEGGDLYSVIKQIVSEHRTGRMTINFSQGGIGSLEWYDGASAKISLDGAAPKGVA